jgi:predicted permease
VLPPILFSYAGEEIPSYVQTRLAPDRLVLLFTLAVSTLACMFFALAPALRVTRGIIPLSSMDRSSTRPAGIAIRTAFLATQVAICTVLLIGAALLTRAVTHAMAFDPGFAMDDVVITAAALPVDGFSPEQRLAFARQLQEQVERASAAVAIASPSPLETNLFMQVRLPDEREPRFVLTSRVSSRYFDVLGLPMVNGTMFNPQNKGEAVVNESMARTFWRAENPLGRTVLNIGRNGDVQATYTIVGVVRDAHLSRLDKVEPMIFTPVTTGRIISRADAALVERIRGLANAINPSAIVRTWPVRDNIWRRLEESRAGAAVAWGVGVLGLALAAVGVFGVFAYAAEERRREIGLRLALGATRPQIIHVLVGTSGRAMLFGLGAGVLASLASGPVLSRYLYGLNPLDPKAYSLVGVLLIAAGALATFIPACRACRVDPAVTLREE